MTPRPSHLQLITSTQDRSPDIPSARRTQSDEEAARKAANVLKMLAAGYVSADEALPWVALELGVGS